MAHPIQVPVDRSALAGDLTVPRGAPAIVIFAHGSGSSRHSPRNQYVARALEQHGLATLLIDLLTADEEQIDRRTAEHRFNIRLLANRLTMIIDWLEQQPATSTLKVGLFGASTGGGAALVAAAERPDRVAAVVSRGGRPDLAGDALPRVKAPTLLIVGGRDEPVIGMNEVAMRHLDVPVALEIVHGATHLFDEPGALERVAALAAAWFRGQTGVRPGSVVV